MQLSLPVSFPSRERFIRLLRATLAKEVGIQGPFAVVASTLASEINSSPHIPANLEVLETIIVVELVDDEGMIRIEPCFGEQALVALQNTRIPPGTLFYVAKNRGVVWLRVSRGFVQVPDSSVECFEQEFVDELGNMWSLAPARLSAYRGIQQRYFHFYIAEMVFRFNYRHEDLGTRITTLLHTVAFQDIQSLLVRNN